jgi:clan AA aspartic protease
LIAGGVTEYRQAIVELTVSGPTGASECLDFIVDTGFDGHMTLHSAIAAALELPRVSQARAFLADGSETLFDTCEAFVLWNGVQRSILVDVSDSVALLGMGLLEGHELRLQAKPLGVVQITPLLDAAA